MNTKVEEALGVEAKTYPGTLYNYSASVYCGVLMPERVMRKLAALQADHLEKVRRLLHDHKDELLVSDWTLHYPDGKQTTVYYSGTSHSTVEDRIRLATINAKPEPRFPVFLANSSAEAIAMADARAALTQGEAK